MTLEIYDDMIAFYLFGYPINWTIASTWIVMAVMLIVSFWATRFLSTKDKVSHWQTAMEVVVKYMYQELNDMSGGYAMRYLPFIGTLFLYIAVCNLMTVFPWFRTPTASLSTTAALAAMVLVGIPFFGIWNGGVKRYLHKYIEPSVAMLPFNILSEFTSTFAMCVRLFGNVLSGVIVGAICLMLMPFIIPLPMQILGLLTGMIQAYIFAVLAVLYVASVSVDEEEPAKENEIQHVKNIIKE